MRRDPCVAPTRRAYDRVTMQGRLLRRRGIVTFAVLVVVRRGRRAGADAPRRRWLHVTPLARTDTSYYPFLLVGVKAAGALPARGARRARPARVGRRRRRRRLLDAAGHAHDTAPRLRPGLSIGSGSRRSPRPRSSTSCTPTPRTPSPAGGRCSRRGCTPTRCRCSRVLAVLVALAWRLAGFLHEIEAFADRTLERVRRILARRRARAARHAHARPTTTPRRGAASASRSSRVLLRSPPDPRSRPVPAGDACRRIEREEDHEHHVRHRPAAARQHDIRAHIDLADRAARRGGRDRLGDPAAVPHHAAAPARAGLLVARRRAAAARRRRRHRLRAASSRGRSSPTWRGIVQPPAEMVHWLFAVGILFVGLCLLARGDRRAARYGTCAAGGSTSGPGSTFVLGVLLWPVMAFFTNSAIHMYAHGSWADVLMLAGARRARARPRPAARRRCGG